MPLPWKKVKNKRITQLVNDHIHSQKRRGNPLVVETGFPTSLVDLFVKNQERLRKPSSSKKKKKSLATDPPLVMETSAATPKTPLLSSPVSAQLDSNLSLFSPAPSPVPPAGLIGGGGSGGAYDLSHNDVARVGEGGRGVDEGVVNGRCVLVAVLKVFCVVVLALGTKRFAVGITMSAFLLFFLEYIGRRVSCKLLPGTPCAGMQRVLRLMVGRVLGIFSRVEEDKLLDGGRRRAMQPKEGSVVYDYDDVIPSCSYQEAGAVGARLVPEIHCDDDGNNDIACCEGELGCEETERNKDAVMKKEDENRDEVSEPKQRKKSHRAKIKSKMKKLVPKKLRSKKKGRDSETEITSTTIEEDNRNNMTCEEEDDEDVEEGQEELEERVFEDEKESDCGSSISSLSSGISDKKCDSLDGESGSGQFSKGIMEATKIEKEDAQKGIGLSSKVVLCLVVLIGLVGGRVIALALTLGWCLMLKSGETLRRYIRSPTSRSVVEMS